MTKVTISGNANGTGNVNFAAPNTNSAITVTLPTSNVDMDSLGTSTTFGDVGTHALLYKTGAGITEGSTHAGSGLVPFGFMSPAQSVDDIGAIEISRGGTAVSGTWRAMGRVNWNSGYTGYYRATLYVRIS